MKTISPQWLRLIRAAFAAGLALSNAAAVTRHVYAAADFNALPSLNAGDIVLMHLGLRGSSG